MYSKKGVLFICTHNAARTQMAEALLNHLYGNSYRAYSAGTSPKRISPYAIKVMAEIGIDISRQKSKSFEKFKGQKFKYVITTCDKLKAVCPHVPGGSICLHWEIPDPEEARGSEEEILAVFREVRNRITMNIESVFGSDS